MSGTLEINVEYQSKASSSKLNERFADLTGGACILSPFGFAKKQGVNGIVKKNNAEGVAITPSGARISDSRDDQEIEVFEINEGERHGVYLCYQHTTKGVTYIAVAGTTTALPSDPTPLNGEEYVYLGELSVTQFTGNYNFTAKSAGLNHIVVAGQTTLNGDTLVYGDTGIYGDTQFFGATQILGELAVSGQTSFDGVTTFNEGTNYEQNANFNANVIVGSSASNKKITVNGTLSLGNQNTTSGLYSFAGGSQSDSGAVNSFAYGLGAKSVSTNSMVIGQYNEETANSYFIVGNGSADNNRSNVFRIAKSITVQYPDDGILLPKVGSNTIVYADGGYSANGADYSEMFEWSDLNSENEDRIGYFVTLDNDGDTIEIASENSEYILGVISYSSSILGDSGAMRWQKKYMTDEWGRIIYEDTETDDGVIKTPKINPEFNSELQYISREERPEWAPVGMLGKLYVRDDGTCEVGKYCKPNKDGVATKSDVGYRVISRVNENIIRIIFR